MKLYELDPKNPIDRELNKTAKNASTNGSLDQDDIDQQNEPPDDGSSDMGDTDVPNDTVSADPDQDPDAVVKDDQADLPSKPVDSALMSRVQSHDYITKYDHSDETSNSNPVKIMGMGMDQLSVLRNKIRVYLDQTSIEDRVGLTSNDDSRAAQDMLSFVDLVMAHKKAAAKDRDTASGKRPRIQTQPSSKVKPGQQFRHKTQK